MKKQYMLIFIIFIVVLSVAATQLLRTKDEVKEKIQQRVTEVIKEKDITIVAAGDITCGDGGWAEGECKHQETAKLFTLHLGHLEKQKEIKTGIQVPQKVRGRNLGDRQDKVDRHIQEHLHRHLKEISKHVDVFVRKHPISGVIIGAHQAFLHTLEKHLPKNVQQKIVAAFHAEPEKSWNLVLDTSKDIMHQVNTRIDQQQTVTNENRINMG